MIEQSPTACFFGRTQYGRYFSGTKLFRVLRRLPSVVANLRWQSSFLWFLMRSRSTRALLVRQPVLPFKYLSHDYLCLAAGEITPESRASALAYHYAFLRSFYKEDFLAQMYGTGVVLSTIQAESQAYTVHLQASGPCYEEGELSLFFRAANVDVYCISFSFVPGDLIGLDVPTLILVSRVPCPGKIGFLSRDPRGHEDPGQPHLAEVHLCPAGRNRPGVGRP
jgi:hypothetical protein